MTNTVLLETFYSNFQKQNHLKRKNFYFNFYAILTEKTTFMHIKGDVVLIYQTNVDMLIEVLLLAEQV